MAEVQKNKKRIVFNRSMNADKRNENFAYLRLNVADVGQKGLYPGANFVPMNSEDVSYRQEKLLDVFHTDNAQPLVATILYPGDTVHLSYAITGASIAYLTSTFAGSNTVSSFVKGSKGVEFVNLVDNKIYAIDPTNSGSEFSNVATFPSSVEASNGCFDGLYYWWVGNKIWRHLGDSSTPELMMSTTGFTTQTVRAVVPYLDYVVVANHGESLNVYNPLQIFFYDKKNSTIFSKRALFEANSYFLALGTIKNRLILVHSREKTSNRSEACSEIVVSAWDGEKFYELNSIIVDGNLVKNPSYYLDQKNACVESLENEIIFCVWGNSYGSNVAHGELSQNYVYSVKYDGSIEAVTNPETTPGGNARAVGRIGIYPRSEIFYAKSFAGSDLTTVFSNANDLKNPQNGFGGFSETKYVTNFHCNPYNYHRLSALCLVFEKLLMNAGVGAPEPELSISFRTSDRDEFSLLKTIKYSDVIADVNKRISMSPSTTVPLPEQRYQFMKMDAGTLQALPEFNEIQFMFEPKFGFAVPDAWFEYEYVTRNVVK